MSAPQNTISEESCQLRCTCGAVAEPKDRKRFLKRHPALCSARQSFNQKLAQTVKSAGPSQTEDADLYRLETIESEGRNLTDWEKNFITQIRCRIDRRGTQVLTPNQRRHLEQVYTERTS